MSDFLKTIERLANLKGIVTLLLVLVVLVFVWRNLDFFNEVTFKVDRGDQGQTTGERPQNSSESDTRRTAADSGVFNPQIVRLELSPVAFALPSYFLVGIKNSTFDPGYVDVTVDFGGAIVRAYEPRPRDSFTRLAGDTGTSLIKGRFSNVGPEESVYLYALLSQPTFDRVIVRGSGAATVRRKTDVEGGGIVREFVSPDMMTFFRILFGVAVVLILILLISIVIAWLNSGSDEKPANSPDPPAA